MITARCRRELERIFVKSRNSTGLMKEISIGTTGSKLRLELGKEVKSSPGKILPGVRTSAYGSGELEYVAGVGTEFYLLKGRTKTTFFPGISSYQ